MKLHLTLFVAGTLALVSTSCNAPEGSTATVTTAPSSDLDRCAVITASVVDAGFGETVSVRCDMQFAYIRSSADPGHDMMNGISLTNERVPVPAVRYELAIPLDPQRAKSITTLETALAVAVNGVPMYDYSDSLSATPRVYDHTSDMKEQGLLDRCNGRAGSADDYHYRAAPTCMVDTMDNAGAGTILGWALDGFPIYGGVNPDGSPIADGALDACNGQYDITFGYRYHTTSSAPYLPACLVGLVTGGRQQEIPPLTATEGVLAAPEDQTPHVVTSLTFTENVGGGRSMTYQHDGDRKSVV